MLLVGNGRLVTRDEGNPYIENGAVVIDNKVIKEVGDFSALKAKYPEAEIIDAKGKLIMPGFVNTHEHVYSAFARGMALDGPPNTNFLEILDGLWWRLDKALTLEDVKYSAYVTFLDSVRFGVTTTFDHHASPNAIDGSLFALADVASEIGLRACLAYEVTDRDGKDKTKAGIKENMAFINHANKGDQDMLRGMFGLHAAFTLDDDSLQWCADAMAGNNAGYHVHIAEGIDDQTINLKKYGKRVVTRLDEYDILNSNSIAVHGIYVDKHELDTLKRNNTTLVHNPESNMGNAVGCSPVIKFISEGLRVGLGTDGYTHDLLESVKVANIIHKDRLGDPTVAWGEVPQMAYYNNPSIANDHFGFKTGVLTSGAKADVILVDYDPRTPFNANTVNSHMLFGVVGKCVTDTIIDGKVIMKDRVIQTVDEEKIYAKARELSDNLWKRA